MIIDWYSLFSTLLPYLPASLASDLTTVFTFIVAGCAVVARFWPRPPDGSKWLWLYKIVNGLAMNSRHATNATSREIKDP